MTFINPTRVKLEYPIETLTAQLAAAFQPKAIAHVVLGTNAGQIAFENIPQQYEALRLSLVAVSALGPSDVLLRFNGDAGANYDNARYGHGGGSFSSALGAGGTSMQIGTIGGGNPQSGAVEVDIPAYSRTSLPRRIVHSRSARFDGDATANWFGYAHTCRWRSSAAVTRIDLLGLTFEAGAVAVLYGLKGV